MQCSFLRKGRSDEIVLDVRCHETVRLWKVDGREHVIGLVELYACVIALEEWNDIISQQRVLLFIDNMELKIAWSKDQPASTPGDNFF